MNYSVGAYAWEMTPEADAVIRDFVQARNSGHVCLLSVPSDHEAGEHFTLGRFPGRPRVGTKQVHRAAEPISMFVTDAMLAAIHGKVIGLVTRHLSDGARVNVMVVKLPTGCGD